MTMLFIPSAAGLIAGLMNAVAGGGSFVTFPALVFLGVPSVAANASSTVALFPASFASAYAYREHFGDQSGIPVRRLLPVSLAGGVTGALLLLWTPQSAFDGLVPWLLLLATLAFAGGQKAARLLPRNMVPQRLQLPVQFVVAVYGGYFGGAVGIIMMASWSLFGANDIHAMNASKSLLVGATNMVAVVCFVLAGKVDWPVAAAMGVGAIVGGYAGAHIGLRIPSARLRLAITVLNIAMTLIFFWRAR